MTNLLFKQGSVRLSIRLSLAGCLFVLGLSVALACGSHVQGLTVTVTTDGSVTTYVTGP